MDTVWSIFIFRDLCEVVGNMHSAVALHVGKQCSGCVCVVEMNIDLFEVNTYSTNISREFWELCILPLEKLS